MDLCEKIRYIVFEKELHSSNYIFLNNYVIFVEDLTKCDDRCLLALAYNNTVGV